MNGERDHLLDEVGGAICLVIFFKASKELLEELGHAKDIHS